MSNGGGVKLKLHFLSANDALLWHVSDEERPKVMKGHSSHYLGLIRTI